jgi:hypothetical protein
MDLEGSPSSSPKLLRSSMAITLLQNSTSKVMELKNPTLDRIRDKDSSSNLISRYGTWQSSFLNFQSIHEKREDIENGIPSTVFNKFTLRFPKEQENSFCKYYFTYSLRKARVGLILVLLFELLTGTLDLLKVNSLGWNIVSKLLIIRYGGIVPLFIFVLASTFSRYWNKCMQFTLGVLSLATFYLFYLQLALTVHAVGSIAPYGVFYLTHTTFLLIYQFSLSRLSFRTRSDRY